MTAVSRRALDYITPGLGNMNGWQERHLDGIRMPRGAERPIVKMLDGWLAYADQHAARYESGIGEDGVLGDAWAAVGAALHRLLDGETGRLDCGALSTIINDTLTAEGFDLNNL